jgi:hypothetical protein
MRCSEQRAPARRRLWVAAGGLLIPTIITASCSGAHPPAQASFPAHVAPVSQPPRAEPRAASEVSAPSRDQGGRSVVATPSGDWWSTIPPTGCTETCPADWLSRRHLGEVSDAGPEGAVFSNTDSSGAIHDAANTVAKMRDAFRTCFQTVLDREPSNRGGTVRLSICVACDGSVQSVHAESAAFDRALLVCMSHVPALASFQKPIGGMSIVNIPITFEKRPRPQVGDAG